MGVQDAPELDCRRSASPRGPSGIKDDATISRQVPMPSHGGLDVVPHEIPSQVLHAKRIRNRTRDVLHNHGHRASGKERRTPDAFVCQQFCVCQCFHACMQFVLETLHTKTERGAMESSMLQDTSRLFVSKAPSVVRATRLKRTKPQEVDGINIFAVMEVGPTFSCPSYTVGKLATTTPDAEGNYWVFDVSLSDFGSMRATPVVTVVEGEKREIVLGHFRVQKETHTLALVEDMSDRPVELIRKMRDANPDWFRGCFAGVPEVARSVDLVCALPDKTWSEEAAESTTMAT